MKYSDIILKETRNSENELYQIHFYQEGDWWRAYEWSSYLVVQVPNGLEEKDKLKPIRKPYKENKDGIILVGLKASSFEKYLPNIKYNVIEDKHMIVDVSGMNLPLFNISDYSTVLSEWKNKYPFKETKEKKEENKTTVELPPYIFNENKNTVMSIVFEIMTYNIDVNNEKNTAFLQKIKNNFLNIFI